MNMKMATLLILAVSHLSKPLMAQTRSQVYGDNLTKQTQTLFLSGTYGMTTFESEAASSKETQTSNSLELGGWFGETRIVGLKMRSREDTVNFSLNQSQSRQNFTDLRLMARILWLVPSVGLSLSEVDVKQSGQSTIGLYGTGINAGLGLNIAIYPGVVVNADAMTVWSQRVYDKLTRNGELLMRHARFE